MMEKGRGEAVFEELRAYYHGFFLDEPVGNNAFSFSARANKRIFVPPFAEGEISEVRAGTACVFSEVSEDGEKNACGLERFIHSRRPGKEIFIFDNHNHAFACWAAGLMAGALAPGQVLVHVDQHKDTRAPGKFLEKGFWQSRTLPKVCDYVNRTLNVGNFVPPALEAGIFAQVIGVDSEGALDEPLPAGCAADIDLDFFSPDMDYIPFEKRLAYVRALIEKSAFVTIATSPYFMDQERALKILKTIVIP